MGAFATCAVEEHFGNFTSMMHQCEKLNSPTAPPPPSPPSPPGLPPLPPHTPCDTPWNQREKLAPPPGTGWRGSTLGTDKLELGGSFSDEQDPEEYERKYGYPLHILRVFKGRGNAQLNDAQLDWVKNKGGIIFYSVYKTYNDWANVGDPAYDWAIDAYVAQFKAVAPAKMWICLRFEPGLYTNAASVNSTKYKGTVHDYKKMWHYIMDYFAAEGVTNAVWAMDYSTEANHDYIHPQLAALWPGDANHTIDWLLWNVFTYTDGRGVPFKEYVGHGYRLFESLSGVPQVCHATPRSPCSCHATQPFFWAPSAPTLATHDPTPPHARPSRFTRRRPPQPPGALRLRRDLHAHRVPQLHRQLDGHAVGHRRVGSQRRQGLADDRRGRPRAVPARLRRRLWLEQLLAAARARLL